MSLGAGIPSRQDHGVGQAFERCAVQYKVCVTRPRGGWRLDGATVVVATADEKDRRGGISARRSITRSNGAQGELGIVIVGLAAPEGRTRCHRR